MNRKKLLPIVASTLLLAGANYVQAETEIIANVSLTTDYKFRGISQSNESAALQGGFDIAFDSGFYVGTWASSVDFDTDGGGYDGSLELDAYAGWGTGIGESGDVSVDMGILYYGYPGDEGPDGDYLEFYGSVSWKALTTGVAYSDDYYAETGEFWYLYADYGLSLPADFGLGFHVGYNDLEKAGGFLSDGQDSYIDYSIALTKEWLSVEWSLAYTGTDLDSKEVFGTDWGDDAVVFSVSKSM